VGPVSNEVNLERKLPNIQFLGIASRFEVKAILNKSDIFLFPSYTEGFSNVMLESMGMGVPIIASTVGANKDMVENNGGILVNPKDIQGLINAIKNMEEVSNRKRMSNWNVNKVKSQYTVDKIMIKLINIYKGIL